MATHSRLGASSMARWSVCARSPRLIDQLPPGAKSESKYALEGTAAHELAASCLLAGRNAPEYIGEMVCGIEVTDEMAEAVQVYLEAVRQVRDTAEPGVLVVMDYKHGRGVPVEVMGNLQLIYYAFGAVYVLPALILPKQLLLVEKHFDLSKLRPDLGGTCDVVFHPGGELHTIRVVVVQPRCGHQDGPVRAWQFPLHELIDWQQDLLDAAARTDDPNAPLVAGPHCKFCPAAAICPELAKKTHALVAVDFTDLTGPAYSPARLAEGLAMIPELESRIEAMRKFAYAELTAGHDIPGWKLVNKRAVRKWTDEDAVAKELAAVPEAFTEPKLKSPAQIETVLGGKKRAGLIVGKYITSESSGTTLAPVSDPRPAVAGALEYFKSETGE